jgi:broad specificity phosphatase PhoE
LSSKKIYIVRHGQTDFNLRNVVQGSGIDSSLNDRGRAQAQAFYNAFKHIPFDKVYTSSLKRTTESIQSFLDGGIPTEALAGLNEISWGTKEGFPITPEADEFYHHMLRQWQIGNTAVKIEKGESPDEVVARMKPALDYILQQEHEKTVLVCMHGRAIRILICMLLNIPLKSMDLYEHQNLGLYLFDYTDSVFTIERHNDTDHLRLVI